MSEFTLKIKLSGYKLCLFSLHPHTLELSFGHFQTLKDQGYQKFTQKIDDFDIAETPKMSVFEQKNPLCNPKKIVLVSAIFMLCLRPLFCILLSKHHCQRMYFDQLLAIVSYSVK